MIPISIHRRIKCPYCEAQANIQLLAKLEVNKENVTTKYEWTIVCDKCGEHIIKDIQEKHLLFPRAYDLMGE